MEALYGYFDALVEESGTLRALEALEAWGRQTGAPSADLVVGYCLFGLGRNGEAVESFWRAHRARPREPTLYALSCALTVTGNAAESRRLLGAASRGRRLTARLLVSLADAHLAGGRPAAAESALRRITPRGASDWSELVESAWERVRRARAAREASVRPHSGRRAARAPGPQGPKAWIWTGPDGAILLRVRAHPGARTSQVGTVDPWRGALRVEVQAQRERGRANEALAEVIALALGISPREVELVQGPRSAEKVFRLRGLTLDAARLRLEGRP